MWENHISSIFEVCTIAIVQAGNAVVDLDDAPTAKQRPVVQNEKEHKVEM